MFISLLLRIKSQIQIRKFVAAFNHIDLKKIGYRYLLSRLHRLHQIHTELIQQPLQRMLLPPLQPPRFIHHMCSTLIGILRVFSMTILNFDSVRVFRSS